LGIQQIPAHSWGTHKYPATVRLPTKWDDNIYTFAGDIEDGDITTITFEAEFFEKTNGEVYNNLPSTIN
jgi:hypothetical protein